MLRRQPPVYSPLSVSAIASSVGQVILGAHRGTEELVDYLQERFDAQAAVLTGSGTQALQLAFTLLPDRSRDRPVVALPGYSCFDLISAAVGSGVGVRFYDIDPRTLTPDLESLEMVLSQGVSAVVAGSLYGYPLAWAALEALCASKDVVLIEDAAQGVDTHGPAGAGGSLGSLTVLSFGRGKGWTGGGGGALLLRRDAISWAGSVNLPRESRLRTARSVVTTGAAWALGRPALYWIPTMIPILNLGVTRYREPEPPGAIGAFSSALARRTAPLAQQAVSGRREVWQRWISGLAAHDRDELTMWPCRPVGGAEAATFLRCAVVFTDVARRRRFLEGAHRLGATGGYPTPLERLPQSAAWIAGSAGPLPGSARLASLLVTLPTHEWAGRLDIESLVEALVSDG